MVQWLHNSMGAPMSKFLEVGLQKFWLSIGVGTLRQQQSFILLTNMQFGYGSGLLGLGQLFQNLESGVI